VGKLVPRSVVILPQKIEDCDPKKIALARKLYADGTTPVKEICDQLDIGRTTLYRYVGKEIQMAL
jgi:DNA invertase Pin-like site-specific DNA recombinase